MMKVPINKKTLLYTHPVFIIGSYDKEGKPNIMAVSWGGICCSNPPCVAISLRRATLTYHNIMAKQAFTLNIPPVGYVKEADYVGIYSGRDFNKFEKTGLTPVKSNLVEAPYVEEFPIILECKVVHSFELGLHTQFVGEILNVLADESVLNNAKMPDINKVMPFIYDSSESAYYGIGKKICNAFSTKDLLPEAEI